MTEKMTEIVESETGLVLGPRHHNVQVGFGTKNRPKQHSLPAAHRYQRRFTSTSSQKLQRPSCCFVVSSLPEPFPAAISVSHCKGSSDLAVFGQTPPP